MVKPKKRPAPKRKPPKAAKRAAPKQRPAPEPRPAPKRGVHDLGGLPAGPIKRDVHDLSPFEERVDALMMLLTNQQGIYKVDSLRRAIESLSGKDYAKLAYYEKWVRGIRMMLVEQDVLTDAEINAKIAAIKARAAKRRAA